MSPKQRGGFMPQITGLYSSFHIMPTLLKMRGSLRNSFASGAFKTTKSHIIHWLWFVVKYVLRCSDMVSSSTQQLVWIVWQAELTFIPYFWISKITILDINNKVGEILYFGYPELLFWKSRIIFGYPEWKIYFGYLK